jgi:hypothetical protein
MGKEHTRDLLKFLKPFSNDLREIVLKLRAFVWDLYPQANELIYDNYNAVAFGWSITEKLGHTFCTMAIGRTSKNIHFGFYFGSKLSDPDKLLLGSGNQYRYILVKDVNKFPTAYIKKLLTESYAFSLSKVKDKDKPASGLTITKSISPVKRTLKSKPSKKTKLKPTKRAGKKVAKKKSK